MKHLKCVLLIVVLIGSLNSVSAIKPVWSYGMLLLQAEEGYGRMRTGYAATVCGAGTWLAKYGWRIYNFCINNPNNTYWAYLPGYGYTQVTAEKLSNMFYYDSDLGLTDMPFSSFMEIRSALLADHALGSYEVESDHLWDPWTLWKWRSAYMETMYSKNGVDENISPNCWGTADYLTGGWHWAEYFPSYTYNQLVMYCDIPEQYIDFPYIYLPGAPVVQLPGAPYSMDFDLNDEANGFDLEGTGVVAGGLKNVLNSFDVIRMSTYPQNPPASEDLLWRENNQNLGTNKHSVAYLCTDHANKVWFYEKGNAGPPVDWPYGIRAFGNDPDWQYENHYRTYFSHKASVKENYATSYEMNWAGVELPDVPGTPCN